MPVAALTILVIVGVAVWFFVRVRDRGRRAGFLKHAGMVLMALFGGFFLLFVVGETVSDPGGWKAVGLITAWLVPLAIVATVAWFRPSIALPILAVLTVAAVGLIGWRALDSGVRELEDRIGPFTTIAFIVIAVAATALAHTDVRAAGVILVAIGSAPFLFWGFSHETDALSVVTMIAGSPIVVAGILFLFSARFSDGTRTKAPDADPVPGSA